MVKRIFSLILIIFVLQVSSIAQITEQTLKFGEVFEKISRFYVDTINEESLIEKVIIDLLHQLDPHSAYLSKEEVKAMQEPLDGSFEGIGVSFNILYDTIYIISPITGGPSEKVGIKAGDRILKINGENVAGIGITNLDVQKKLKGPKGTKVNVSIYRRNSADLLEFVITRDQIPIYSIDATYMINDNTGYIKLSRFSGTTMNEFMDAIGKLKRLNMQNLILDLSGNGGGYLRVAVDLADQFVEGSKMIVYTEGMQNPRRNYMSTDKGEMKNGRLVVMIDESSASASEIVAGALQDWDRSVIVGRRSFGKGLVQQPFMLTDGSLIRLTVAKYYTPTGRLIQKSYEEGYENYAKELVSRYNNGELSREDSGIFPDSLKYRTLTKNRVVFGGGGIMPDYFVPIDTTYYSDYYRALISKGIMNRFILSYVDDHRNQLKKSYPEFKLFHDSYNPSEEMMQQLITYAADEGIEYNDADFIRSRSMIEILLKAYIARDIWETSEFYQIINQSDPIFNRAVEIISSSTLYDKKLHAYTGD